MVEEAAAFGPRHLCLRSVTWMSDSNRPELVLCSVSIEGLEANASAIVEHEVRVQFELARQSGIALREPAEVTVHVTDETAIAVDRFNLECGISAPPYGRERPTGISGGIVLTTPGVASPAKHTRSEERRVG